jgi:hypothetical protein
VCPSWSLGALVVKLPLLVAAWQDGSASMWNQPDNDQFTGELFLAGQLVPAGLYRHVGSGRSVRLDREDFLPASFAGHVASYVLVRETWEHAPETKSEGRGGA